MPSPTPTTTTGRDGFLDRAGKAIIKCTIWPHTPIACWSSIRDLGRSTRAVATRSTTQNNSSRADDNYSFPIVGNALSAIGGLTLRPQEHTGMGPSIEFLCPRSVACNPSDAPAFCLAPRPDHVVGFHDVLMTKSEKREDLASAAMRSRP